MTEDESRPKKKIFPIILKDSTIDKLCTSVAYGQEHTQIGKTQGPAPSQFEFNKWGREELHESFTDIISKGQGFFEAHFSSPIGKQFTLSHADYKFNNRTVMFVEWTPHFDPGDNAASVLQYPLWAQIKGLPRFLRTEDFLREVIGQFAHVVYIENSDSYRARTLGLRVRIITNKVSELPDTLHIPKIDGDGGVYHDIIYTGSPDECERRHKKDHTVKYCKVPKKHFRKDRESRQRATT
ncbi:hypothetical protein M758_UG251000 [Ceratodon purpureus]|nr:hypothetical protein M758_UG251000 [Ceratodon purpureus]